MPGIPFILVGMTGFEPATSCSQSRRATICATSRFIVFLCGEKYVTKSALSALLAVPETRFAYFDRCAKPTFLIPLQAAVGRFAQSRRATICATSRKSYLNIITIQSRFVKSFWKTYYHFGDFSNCLPLLLDIKIKKWYNYVSIV